ncbi:hypothetical protein MHU86_17552 [Fragilaria crotonensis]|nr:hypothetical protein MHU86_17552 [Fragilaria crotonensis]
MAAPWSLDLLGLTKECAPVSHQQRRLGVDWLRPDCKESGIRFGRAVAVSYEGDRVAATSFFHDSTRGHVRVFDLIDETWIEQYDIEGSMVGDWLGWVISG